MKPRALAVAWAVLLSLGVVASSASAATFSNPTPIAINNPFAATPYPSTIAVSGTTGTATGVRVTLSQLSEPFPNDLDILLVGPTGAKTLLMSDTCGSGATPINAQTLVFDDAATSLLPMTPNQCAGGTYKPTDYNDGTGTDTFEGSAPAGPYVVTLSVFNGLPTNGTWQLWVRDDFAGGEPANATGSIAGGWSLDTSTPLAPVTTTKKKCRKKKHGKHKAAVAKKKKCKKRAK